MVGVSRHTTLEEKYRREMGKSHEKSVFDDLRRKGVTEGKKKKESEKEGGGGGEDGSES